MIFLHFNIGLRNTNPTNVTKRNIFSHCQSVCSHSGFYMLYGVNVIFYINLISLFCFLIILCYQIFGIFYFVFTYMYISYYNLYINPNTHWYIQNKLEIIVWRNRYRCTIDRGCQHRSEQTKCYDIDICWFSALLMSMIKKMVVLESG